MAEGLDRDSAFDDARATAVRRTAVTIRGEGVAPCEDSLFGEDDALSIRGPEWCIDTGHEILAMNKFELWLALGAGDYAPATLVWKVGRERWQPAEEIAELACALKLHRDALMAAEQLGREAQAATPEAGTTHVVTTSDDLALADTLIATPPPDAPLALSGRPEEPEYVVRGARPKRRTDVRVHIVSGLTVLGAIAATVLLISAGRAELSRGAARVSGQAAQAVVAPEAPPTSGQGAEAEASVSVDHADAPKVEPARHGKSVSPTHRGQERARRKGH